MRSIFALIFFVLIASAAHAGNSWYPSKRAHGPYLVRMITTNYKSKNTTVETFCKITPSRVTVYSTVRPTKALSSQKVIRRHSKIIRDKRLTLSPFYFEIGIRNASECKQIRIKDPKNQFDFNENIVQLTKVGFVPNIPEFHIEANNIILRNCNGGAAYLLQFTDVEKNCKISE